jgi:hypothetical protein
MRLLAMVTDPASIARYLAAIGEATEVPPRSPNRGPPYWKSRVLRRQATGDEDECRSDSRGETRRGKEGGESAGCPRSRALCA